MGRTAVEQAVLGRFPIGSENLPPATTLPFDFAQDRRADSGAFASLTPDSRGFRVSDSRFFRDQSHKNGDTTTRNPPLQPW
jgi:hypothetical protein